MSMMGRFVQVSPDRLKQILDDPSVVEALLRGSPQGPSPMPGLSPMAQALGNSLLNRAPEALMGAINALDPANREKVNQSLRELGVDLDAIARGEGRDALAKVLVQRAKARFAGRAARQPPASAAGALTAGKGADISIDKAWHGVHYLLCGHAVPGTDLASQAVMGGTDVGDDLGYGPARYFTPDQVAAMAGELSRPNLEAEMNARFDPDQMMQLGIYPVQFDDPDDRDWLMGEFRKLRQFYVDASAAGLAVVACIE
jgi:hypothetical protein